MTRSVAAASWLAATLLITLLTVAPAAGSGPAATVTASVAVNPLSVELEVPSRPLTVGQQIQIQAAVRNLGTEPLQEVVATLRVSEVSVHAYDLSQTLDALAGQQQTRARWKLCGETPGNYMLLVHVTATLGGSPIEATSAARLLTVAETRRPTPPACR
jgi:hypothetical protein